jgi:uncharacterized hydrophobic protein (TIGR00271 family)
MLVHIRLNVPTSFTGQVRELLVDHEHVTNVVLLEGASIDPAGDLLECDVARETASQLLRSLDALGVAEEGGIVLTTPSGTPFAAARRLERLAPGDPQDAVVWDNVVADAYAASRPTVTYHVFLVLATILASVAVITDSSVLVVGAMVVGPEFGTVAAVCTGLVFARWGLAWASLRLLVLGFAFAIAVVTLLALLLVMTGVITAEMVTRPRPQTGFIWHPDIWSFVVALVAGAAGVLALSTDRAQAMVGVFISVTTVPAAGNLALGIATWQASEMIGSAAQLGVNLLGMVLAGTVVLALQRLLWERVMTRTAGWFGLGRQDSARR